MEDDVLIFTEEDLALMLDTPISKHYIYYDKKSGAILSVANELLTRFEYFIEVDSPLAQLFLDGTYNILDYVVGYDGAKSGLTVVKKEDQDFTRKTNLFEKISKTNDLENKEFIVEWNSKDSCWNFSINEKFKDHLQDLGFTFRVTVFVSKDDDLNMILRSIYLDTDMLFSKDKISIPFESYLENDINKIVVSSKSVFNTYGLRIIND